MSKTSIVELQHNSGVLCLAKGLLDFEVESCELLHIVREQGISERRGLNYPEVGNS